MREPYIDDDVPRTRRHYYPTWILFTGAGLPRLLRRIEAGQDICDCAIRAGAAVAIPKRHNSIAAALSCMLWMDYMWSYHIEFLFMLQNSGQYRKGWLDFLDAVSQKVANSTCLRHGLVADGQTASELRAEVTNRMHEYFKSTEYYRVEVSFDQYGAKFCRAVREFEIRARYEAEMLIFLFVPPEVTIGTT